MVSPPFFESFKPALTYHAIGCEVHHVEMVVEEQSRSSTPLIVGSSILREEYKKAQTG